MNRVNEHQEECLEILQEECAEVIQAASKIKRFGIDSRKNAESQTNLENLEMELGDVLAMIDLCKEAGIGITEAGLEKAKIAKKERVKLWMHTNMDTRSTL